MADNENKFIQLEGLLKDFETREMKRELKRKDSIVKRFATGNKNVVPNKMNLKGPKRRR